MNNRKQLTYIVVKAILNKKSKLHELYVQLMKIVFSMFLKTMKITTIILVFILLGYDTTKSSPLPLKKRFLSFYDNSDLPFTKGFGKLTFNKQKKIETTFQRK